MSPCFSSNSALLRLCHLRRVSEAYAHVTDLIWRLLEGCGGDETHQLKFLLSIRKKAAMSDEKQRDVRTRSLRNPTAAPGASCREDMRRRAARFRLHRTAERMSPHRPADAADGLSSHDDARSAPRVVVDTSKKPSTLPSRKARHRVL